MTATPPATQVEPEDHDQSEPGRGDRWLAGTGDGTDPDRHVHVVVLGLPGVGTSTIGRRLAHELQRPYVDHDSIVALEREQSGDRPDGSADTDLVALRRVLATHGSVVYAAGGQVADRADPADLADAYVVWLDAAPEVVADRLGGREHPVLGAEPLPALSELAAALDARADELADLRVAVDECDPADATERIRKAWRRHVDELISTGRNGRVT